MSAPGTITKLTAPLGYCQHAVGPSYSYAGCARKGWYKVQGRPDAFCKQHAEYASAGVLRKMVKLAKLREDMAIKRAARESKKNPSNATSLASVARELNTTPAKARALIKEAGLKVVGRHVIDDPKSDGMGWDRLAELSGNFEIIKNPAAKWKRSDYGAMLVGPSFTFYVQRRIRRGFGLQEHGTKTYYVLVRTPTGGTVGGYHTQEMGVEYPSAAEAKTAAENWIATGKPA